MANFFTRALDKITPWDRGGEVERRKKREEESRALQVRQAPVARQSAPQPRNYVEAPQQLQAPKPKQPENVFESLNKNLAFGQPSNAVKVINDPSNQVVAAPKPGTIVKPKQSIFNKVRDVVDANTEADKYRRTVREANKIEGNMIRSGVDATKARSSAVDIAKNTSNVPYRRGIDALRDTVTGTAYEFIGKPVKTVIGTPVESGRSVLADITGNEAAKQAAERRLNENLFRKEGADKIDRGESLGVMDALSAAGDAVSVLPVLKALGLAGTGLKTGIGTRSIKPVISGAGAALDEATIGIRNFFRPKIPVPTQLENVLSNADLEELTKVTNIPVRQNIPINEVLGEPIGIPVRNMTEPKPLIREFPGDATLATPDPLIRQFAQDIKDEAGIIANNQTRPNQRSINLSEGITPQKAEPFKLDANTAIKSQDEAIDAYAKWLKDMGEGNGVNLVPDGEAYGYGKKLVSDNVRFGDTKGKKYVTKAMWRDEAERQLKAGKADPSIQRVFDEADNPEVQSLLKQGEQVPTEAPRPIAVKEVKGIDVRDETIVPQNLPEKPGTVRATTASAPSNTKSQAVASQPTAPNNKSVSSSERAKFGDKAKTISDDTNEIIDRAAAGDIEGAKSGVNRMIEDPEYFSTTKRSAAIRERVAKLNKYIEEQRIKQSQSSVPKTNADVPSKLPANDIEFLRSINDPTQANIRQARVALKNRQKVMKTEKGFRSGAIETARERVRAAGGSLEDQDRAVAAAMRGSFGDVEYKGTSIGDEAEQRLSDMIANDPDLKGLGYSKENIQRAYRNLYHTGEEGYPDHIIKSDLKYIGRWLNRKVPSMGDAFEEAAKELDGLDEASLKVQIAAMPRVIQASADVGGIGRQAMPLGLSNPKQFKDAVIESFKGMFSQKYYDDAIKAIERDKNFYFVNDEMKVALPGVVKDWKAGEQFAASGLSEKIPVLGRVVKASQRQYDLLLTKLRYDVAVKKIVKDGGIASIIKAADESGNPKLFKQAYGDAINLLSGKSDIGNLIKNNPGAMNSMFFSAPNLASKINRLNPIYYGKLWKANPSAAKTAMAGTAVHLATVGSVIAGANQAGLIEDGKIKVGNTRYDITGGLVTLINTGAKMYKAATGEGTGGPFDKTATDEFTNFLRNQLNPVLGTALALFDTKPKEGENFFTNREDKFGNDFNMATDAAKSFTVPFSVQQLYEDITSGLTTPTQAAANLLAGTVGVGVNTYQSGADKEAPQTQETKDILKQFKKEGIGITDTDIENYVTDGDFDKATRVAEYNLKKLQENENAGSSEIAKAEQKLSELKLQKGGVPMTDDGITAKIENGDWDKAIEGYKYKIDRAKKDGEISAKTEGDIKNDIKRLEVSRDNKFTPELFDDYKSVTLESWRKMGDPEDEEYDPDMYQKLWDIDQKMTENGVSYKKGALDKNKYYAKTKGSGRGGSGGSGARKISTDFGTLKAGSFAPKVQEYASIDAKSGSIPRIGVKRPNIVNQIKQG